MYRTVSNGCPRCGTPLRRTRNASTCHGCHGRFLEEQVILEMASDMQVPATPLAFLPLSPRTDSPLHCPVCDKPMEPVRLATVLLDRCPAHGIWFDPEELSDALLLFARSESIAQLEEQARAHGYRPSWLSLELATGDGAPERRAFHEATISIGGHPASTIRADVVVELAAAIYRMGAKQPPLIKAHGVAAVLVNGRKVAQAPLAVDDVVVLEGLELKVLSIGAGASADADALEGGAAGVSPK
jgi:Zn-finger nucleic acid-binding protein